MKRYIKSAVALMADQLPDMNPWEIEELAADHRATAEDLWTIYRFAKSSSDSRIRNGCQFVLAKNPALPDNLLSILIDDDGFVGVQLSLLFNPKLPESDAARIVRYNERWLDSWVGGENTDPLFLRRVLTYCKNPDLVQHLKEKLQKQGIEV